MIDQTDKKILRILEKDARTTMHRLGELVNLSAPAVKERVKKLEEKGIIEGYQAKINFSALHRPVLAYILFETSNCKALREFCSSYPDVLACHRLAGNYSYLVKIATASMETLESFIDETLAYGQSNTHVVFSSFEKNVML